MDAASGFRPRASIVIVCHRRVDLLGDCLRSLERGLAPGVASEAIVLFNGTPAPARERVRPLLGGARVLVSDVNLGFAAGNNRAAGQAIGEYLVFLNDDAVVQPGWLEALVSTADAHPDAGAVGSRILLPDGTLQEAGSVIWSDGSSIGVGRGLPRGSRRYDYLREVDYASACSLLVRRASFERLGGFDERYFPAYNEDLDLALGIHRLGQRVLYQPRSVVVHHESGSGLESRTFLILRGRALLREKWGRELERFPTPAPTSPTAIELAVHRARRSPRRLLIVDDRLPSPGMGSGFPRMFAAIRELALGGYAVALTPTASAAGDRRALQDLGVEVVDDELRAHLSTPGVLYDAVVISRPHNFEKAVRAVRRHQPQAALIYDAEALFHRRLQREAAITRATDPAAADRLLARAEYERERERWIARTADRVVAVSPVEADVLRTVRGHSPVEIHDGFSSQIAMSARGFAQRRGAAFVAGWLGGYPSPNTDALEWFVGRVLPVLKRRLPWVLLTVTGANPPAEMLGLAGPSVRFVGHVADLADLYDAVRVAVVPTRYGAGIKNKALEALQFGVPVVASAIGAEGIDAGAPALEVSDDPDEFAQRVLALLTDRSRWEQARGAIGRLHDRWSSSDRPSWPGIVETALQENTRGRLALHR